MFNEKFAKPFPRKAASSETIDELFPALLPADFFSFSIEVRHVDKKEGLKKTHFLPDAHSFLSEECFSKVALGWNEQGILALCEVDKPFEKSLFPDFRSADSLELFFDTRNVKNAGFMTRFCHHFIFLPDRESSEGLEITRFRTEDTHPLADPSDFEVETLFARTSYLLKIFIPSQCLHGYDPLSLAQMGFAYRVNRMGGEPDHFFLSSKSFSIEHHPSLWSSCHLTKDKK